MINIERMLGGLLQSTLSGALRPRARRRYGGRVFGASRGALGMGIIGVAMAAFDHFLKGRAAAAPSPPSAPQRAGGFASPPPPPTAAISRAGGSGPPPPPPAASAPPTSAASEQALLLLRAMVAAANADHVIDADERARIIDHLSSMGLSSEERDFLHGEIARPRSLDQVAQGALSQGLGEEVYLVSLLAIDLDSVAERAYLADLASKLHLDAATIERCQQQAGASGSA